MTNLESAHQDLEHASQDLMHIRILNTLVKLRMMLQKDVEDIIS